MKYKDTILSLIRHGLTFGGAILATKGYISGDAVATLIPSIVAAIGAVWGATDEFLAARKAAKEAAPAAK